MTSPSATLALSKNWKLTLPTGSAGHPAEIKQPQLQTYTDKNFRVSSGAVVFTAPCGGVTTSGSSYPRSELREMTSNGTKLASWSNKSKTHSMQITQAITHLPVAKPHVVAGQIHDAFDDVCVLRCEGSKLYLTKGDDAHYALITSSYTLGTSFTIKFTARPGGIDVSYNSGAWTHTIAGTFSGCYFKAGCYTQSNPSKGDSKSAYGQVAISSLVIDGVAVPAVKPPARPQPVPDDNPCGG